MCIRDSSWISDADRKPTQGALLVYGELRPEVVLPVSLGKGPFGVRFFGLWQGCRVFRGAVQQPLSRLQGSSYASLAGGVDALVFSVSLLSKPGLARVEQVEISFGFPLSESRWRC